MEELMADSASLRSPRGAAADFIAASEAEQLDLHSLLVLRHGTVVAEAYRAPFDADTPHRMYSVTKSFTSSAIGLAIADGLLTVEDRVVDIFPDLAPHPIDQHLAALRVKHLLTMSAEHPALPGPRTSPSVAAFLAEKLVLPPGSRFDYSNRCSYLLAAIVQRLTGEPLDDYLRPRLFDPLGIAVRPWLKSEEGVNNGGWGLHLTTRELARFGQLYLQRGIWEGCRILPGAWVSEATSKRVELWGNAGAPDWSAGYGYQFWQGRHGSHRADGLLGQFCLLLPRLDALIATTAGTLATQRILDLAWETLLPALGEVAGAAADDAMPAFPSALTGAAGSPRARELDRVTFVLGEPFPLPTRFYGGEVPIVSAKTELGGRCSRPCPDRRPHGLPPAHRREHMGRRDKPRFHGLSRALQRPRPLGSARSPGGRTGLHRGRLPHDVGLRSRPCSADAQDPGKSGSRRPRDHRQAVSLRRFRRAPVAAGAHDLGGHDRGGYMK